MDRTAVEDVEESRNMDVEEEKKHNSEDDDPIDITEITEENRVAIIGQIVHYTKWHSVGSGADIKYICCWRLKYPAKMNTSRSRRFNSRFEEAVAVLDTFG